MAQLAAVLGGSLSLEPPSDFVLTDGSGHFQLEGIHAGASLHLGFWAEGHVPTAIAVLHDREADGDLGVFVLPRGIRLLGRVTDGRGTPIPDVEVMVSNRDVGVVESRMQSWRRTVVTTDVMGEFDLGICLPGRYVFRTPDYFLVGDATVTLDPTMREHRVSLAVEPGAGDQVLVGRVWNGMGEPVPGAEVHATSGKGGGWRSTTGRSGEFRLVRSTSETESVRVSAIAEGYDLTVLDAHVEWGRSDVDLTLRVLPCLSLRVVDAQNAPVDDFSVRLFRLSAHPLAPLRILPYDHEARSTSDGLTICQLISGLYSLRVDPKGRDDLSRSAHVTVVLEPAERGTEAKALLVVLPNHATRRVRVLSPDGTPIPDCEAELYMERPDAREGDPSGSFGHQLMLTADEMFLMRGRTDQSGEMVLEGPSEMPLVLDLRGPGCIPKTVHLPKLDGGDVLNVSMELAGIVRVSAVPMEVSRDLSRVLPKPPMLRFVPGATNLRAKADAVLMDERSVVLDGRSVSSSTSAALEWNLELPPGRWVPVLDLRWDQLILQEFALERGDVHHLVLDLEPSAPAVLEGRLVLDSEPLPLARFELQRFGRLAAQQAPYWRARPMLTDAVGRFRVEGLPGSYRVVVSRADLGPDRILAVPGTIHLEPGEERFQEFRIELGELRLRFFDDERRPVEGVRAVELLRDSDSGRYAAVGPSDVEGWIRLPRCEAGAFHLRTLPARLSDPRAQVEFAMQRNDLGALDRERIDLGTVSVPPGGSVEREVVLPLHYFAP